MSSPDNYMYKFRWLVYLMFVPIFSFCQDENDMLLIKVSIINRPINVYSNSYIFIGTEDLLSCKDSIIDTDGLDILYNLTNCKGYYVSKNRFAIYAKACCDSIDPRKVYNLYSKDKNKFGDLSDYKDAENLDLSKLPTKKSRILYLETNTKNVVCSINIWGINAEYCICEQITTVDYRIKNYKEICQLTKLNKLEKLRYRKFKKIKEKIEYIFSKEKW